MFKVATRLGRMRPELKTLWNNISVPLPKLASLDAALRGKLSFHCQKGGFRYKDARPKSHGKDFTRSLWTWCTKKFGFVKGESATCTDGISYEPKSLINYATRIIGGPFHVSAQSGRLIGYSQFKPKISPSKNSQ